MQLQRVLTRTQKSSWLDTVHRHFPSGEVMAYLARNARSAVGRLASARWHAAAVRAASFYAGNGTLGIVREDKYAWERRVPLCPNQVKKLTDEGYKVLVQVGVVALFDRESSADARFAGSLPTSASSATKSMRRWARP